MKLEVGQIFNKNGKEYCVLELLSFNNKEYVLFSVESTKLDYLFYEIISQHDDYRLNLVTDNMELYELMNKVGGNKDE